MVDVRGDVLRPLHGTTPAAVKSNMPASLIFEKLLIQSGMKDYFSNYKKQA